MRCLDGNLSAVTCTRKRGAMKILFEIPWIARIYRYFFYKLINARSLKIREIEREMKKLIRFDGNRENG